MRQLGVLERTACAVLGQHRSTGLKVPRGTDDEVALTADIMELATRCGPHGYRWATAQLREADRAVTR
ncbi:hypothetical protein [Roseomonas sp. CAU 1739]|uniref:hypothetical protein n=1 Tax=Roseomonas sp. CAU 1739 TaxID=3140364 RepID=UPI0038D04FF4